MYATEMELYERKRARQRIARRRRRRRQRLTLLALVALIFILMGLVFGLHRYRSENSSPKYSMAADTPMVNQAVEQIGSRGGDEFWSWYGFSNRVEWCATFVSWLAEQNGYIDSGEAPKFALVSDGIEWFQARDKWLSGSDTPDPGDLVFFDWDGDGYADHVGLVSNVVGNTILTIEGNSGDMVRYKRYTKGNKCLLGYGQIDE